MKRTLVVWTAILICASVVLGQAANQQSKPSPKKEAGKPSAPAQGGMMKPGLEQKRLGYFIGTWHMEGDAKQSAFGPAGKFSGDETDEWWSGGFFVVAKAVAKGPMGEEKSLSVMGYDPQKKVYTYDAYSNMGSHESATGTYENGTWTWSNEMNMGGKNIKGHFIIKEESPTSFTFKFENSVDSGPWETIMEGKGTKTK
jgi:hypothetical protein